MRIINKLRLLGKFKKILFHQGFIVSRTLPVNLGRKRDIDLFEYCEDYIRYSTFELIAYEIKTNNISGNCAEVGVFRGNFAKKINEVFPNKLLYLFDTFEGFPVEDVNIDKQWSNLIDIDKNKFKKTTVELVLSKMKYPEKCIIKKGYFPNTVLDVNDNFCFISLDADLYDPTIEGLKYFYPRLVEGGFIFIHDYNNNTYKGVKDAVKTFSCQYKIPYLPISDGGGTVVIVK